MTPLQLALLTRALEWGTSVTIIHVAACLTVTPPRVSAPAGAGAK